ncbi:MAG: transposase, partial [Gammaproteobacteria bacterium]|nr:transposase [Gammaproteobacteria bacterium]
WLQEYSCNIVRFSLKPIEFQYRKFFNHPNEGLPKFRAKWRDAPSFPVVIGQTARLNGQWLHIQKVGYVRLTGNNPYPEGVAKSGTVREENGKWYAYVVYAVEASTSATTDDAVGIDRNAGQIALSDGTIYHAPDVAKKERRRKRYQRMMARRQKPVHKKGIDASGRYLKARRLAGRTSQKIRQISDNWVHQVSREIADRYSLVYLEDLKIRNMTRSTKGTVEQPGTNVRQKSGLNRSILKTGWYKLERVLAYKTTVQKVAPHYTSQRCSRCGVTDRNNRRTQSEFRCVGCGHSDNADVNAAKNILALGIGERINGRGEGRSLSVKRQKELGGTLSFTVCS